MTRGQRPLFIGLIIYENRSPMPYTTRHLVSIIVTFLLAVSCSNLRIVYNQLDWFLPAYIDRYINLEDKQYRFVESSVDDLLKWHCQYELPGYAVMLNAIADDLKKENLTKIAINNYRLQMDRFWRDIANQVTPPVVAFFQTITDEQIVQLTKELKQQNDEIREEFIDASHDDIQELLAKRMEGRVERWFDVLDDKQKLIIKDWSTKVTGGQKIWFDNRLKWQSLFLSVIQQYRNDKGRLFTEMNQLINQPEKMRTVEYEKYVNEYQENMLDLLVKLVESITLEQKKYMINALKSYASDFSELSCQAS